MRPGSRSLRLAATLLLFLVFAARSRSLAKPPRQALVWSIQAYAIAKGFLLKPYPPSGYPTDATVLKAPEPFNVS